MSDQHIETCPDNHHCLHGSKCVQNPYDEGSYYCDCDEVIWDVRYEGLFCEHKETVYCGSYVKDGINKHWFCTNNGACITEGAPGTTWGCDCPADYEGSYCQFVKGSKPKGYPYNISNNNNSKSGSSSSPIAGAVVGSLVTILVIATICTALYYRRKLGYDKSPSSVTGRDLELDMDGSSMMMRDAVSKKSLNDAPTLGDRNERPNNFHKQQSDAGLSYASSDWGKNIPQDRPSTRQSEAGLSYAPSAKDEDDSMISLT